MKNCPWGIVATVLGALSLLLVCLLPLAFFDPDLSPLFRQVGLLMFIAVVLGCASTCAGIYARVDIQLSEDLKGERIAGAGRNLGAAGIVLSLIFLLSYFGRYRLESIYNEFFRMDILRDSMPFLARGLVYTIRVAVVAEGLILVAGLVVALLRISRVRVLRSAAAVYIDVVRGIPLLLQVIWIYFGLTYLGFNLSSFAAGVVALTVCYAAYEAEIFRAGIESIHKGQMEAARSLGMGYFKAMRYVILPQAVRRVIPPLSNEFIALLKDTALLSVIAVPELLQRARELMGKKANVTPLVGAALCYLLVTIPLMFLVRYIEKRMAKGE